MPARIWQALKPFSGAGTIHGTTYAESWVGISSVFAALPRRLSIIDPCSYSLHSNGGRS
jgi:hypothetical protein